MLTQLVELLENQENGLSLSEISRAVNAQPTAVLSMIQLQCAIRKILLLRFLFFENSSQ